mgnify:CR=1 FL=1
MGTPYKTFSYHTFGCKVNFADSSYIARQVIDKGLSQVSIDDYADICLINTCSVTEKADNKAKKMIKTIHNKFPETKIVVFGCYAQLKPKEISELDGVAAVVSTENKFNVSDIIYEDKLDDSYSISDINDIQKFNISYSLSERVRAFIKIQDGCDYNCSYCTIPNARGASRSFNIKDTIDELDTIISNGTKEIVLSGINIGDFGKQYNESLYDLLVEIESLNDLHRYRISSIEPNLLTDEIIELISKSDKAMPHFHIPLQSGSDKILKFMKRRYSLNDYISVINKVSNKIPGVCIGVDVIVGFPGETDEDFNMTYNLLEKLNVSYLHVFTYSQRDNTTSQKIPSKVDSSIKATRRDKLKRLSAVKYRNFIDGNIDRELNILFEKHTDGILSGWTENYIRVNVESKENYTNQIKTVKLMDNHSINGILV